MANELCIRVNSQVHNDTFNVNLRELIILGFHSRDETAMLVYKTMAKRRSGFA